MRHIRRSKAPNTPAEEIEKVRHEIARNLGIDVELIRYGNLGRKGKLGTSDPHWMIRYRGEWQELPWHFNGPLDVTWDLIRRWQR
jgi:hypothetical protein